ncbi:MAG: GTP-binding protein [Aquificaceae bacterium]|nr:MAG: GTP-binding protein [Aquificaceae bacterium]
MLRKKIQNIPTTLITGFLGVGKTSAILHLMSQKPTDEKWSVLVNEFGSIGIDGAIYKAKGIEVKEIPGGCMCCAAGVPLQVVVNRILTETKPQRLLIEPSGLGHPKRVLDTLQSQYFKEALSLQASICLLDPRNLFDERYTSHENFIDQIAIADILVANKSDLCDSDTLKHFDAYAAALRPNKQQIIKTQFGRLDTALLDYKPEIKRNAQFPHFHETGNTKTPTSETIERDGYHSEGWIFSQDDIFDFNKITSFFELFEKTRIKAILQTNQGWKVFNIQDKQKQTDTIAAAADSRLEIISYNQQKLNKEKLSLQLAHCLLSSPSRS